MASIDNIFDAIRAAIPTYTGFANKTEILNPYSLEDNPETVLENGWGIIIGDGPRSDKDSPVEVYSVSTVRSIGVVLARSVYDINGQCGNLNNEVKSLLLDAKTIRNNFLLDSKFGVLKNGEEIAYLGDNGVEFTLGDKIRVISTQIDFTFETVENIN